MQSIIQLFIKAMSTIVLSNATSTTKVRVETIQSGKYTLVGFKKHEYDSNGKTRTTYAPVVVRLEDQNGMLMPVSMHMIARSDMTIKLFPIQLSGQKELQLGQIPVSKNNTGTLVKALTNFVSMPGTNSDVRWINIVLPQYRNKVFEVRLDEFSGISRKKNEYSAHVYEMNESPTMCNLAFAQLQQLATAKGWKAEDLVGMDGTPITFTDKNNVTIEFDADGRLISKMVKVGDDYVVATNA